MSFFAGRVIIITGSSNGIGRGTAVLFAKNGAKVTITGRNAETLEETRQLCLKAGAKDYEILQVCTWSKDFFTRCSFQLIGDVTDESFTAKLVSATVEKFGKLDVLVNNAGGASIESFNKGIMDLPVGEFDKMMELNVKPVLRLSQLAVPHLEKTKGAIVNVSSIGAFHHLNPIPYYGAAKSALDQVTIQMAGSLAKKGIRVNSVNPGPVLTNFAVAAGASKEMSDKLFEDMAANPMIPLGRIALPEDIGKIILFLANRSQSEILIGHIVTADGGVMLKSAMFPDA
ncbi:hypothetical protein PFISCL1PPCAC_14110 [Pristionchus fissidentatus]|uniref:Dehydrogenase n=1 Tax=Pristionchus fissidentatus TaxID=1538716 RepID=A0AAV5VX24_9BILA|nr:hypothetical protein PFISCL1PPCAC_14109 [Pristionchus fissidentatus]GMT22813.1 hypothetical protein PFISCL1PPCAC_14110 [Pristionchus fissidentatus]